MKFQASFRALLFSHAMIHIAECKSAIRYQSIVSRGHIAPRCSAQSPSFVSPINSLPATAQKHQTCLSSSAPRPPPSSFPSWERITNHQTSKTVKLFKSVHKANKSKRLQLGLTVAEGVRLVTDILADEQSRKFIRRIVISEELLSSVDDGDDNQRKLQHWLRVVHNESIQRKKDYDESDGETSNDNSCSINVGTEQVVTACAGTVTTQGIVALMQIPEPFNPLFNSSKNSPFYLVLDGLADPGNVGTLLRSCAASNVDALILLPDSCDVYNPKAVRSAMGASFRVPVLDLGDSRVADDLKPRDFEELLELFEQCGIDSTRVFAATMEDSASQPNGRLLRTSMPYYKVDWIANTAGESGGAAVILGKEGEGLRNEVCNAVQQGKISTVHVPMAQGTESLNAAVCGSVIMFERMRQLLITDELNQ
jgi:tRNA G18 (ribose-2'-O)-methylase SpoU